MIGVRDANDVCNGGLLHGEGGWNLNTARMSASLQSLTREILEIETSANQERAAKLLAEYGSVTPPIQTALDRLAPRHGPKARVIYRVVFLRTAKLVYHTTLQGT